MIVRDEWKASFPERSVRGQFRNSARSKVVPSTVPPQSGGVLEHEQTLSDKGCSGVLTTGSPASDRSSLTRVVEVDAVIVRDKRKDFRNAASTTERISIRDNRNHECLSTGVAPQTLRRMQETPGQRRGAQWQVLVPWNPGPRTRSTRRPRRSCRVTRTRRGGAVDSTRPSFGPERSACAARPRPSWRLLRARRDECYREPTLEARAELVRQNSRSRPTEFCRRCAHGFWGRTPSVGRHPLVSVAGLPSSKIAWMMVRAPGSGPWAKKSPAGERKPQLGARVSLAVSGTKHVHVCDWDVLGHDDVEEKAGRSSQVTNDPRVTSEKPRRTRWLRANTGIGHGTSTAAIPFTVARD